MSGTLPDEWVAKAEADYRAAVTLNRPRNEPLPDIVCFHCQQSAEKYLKAYLIAQGEIPPRTHALDQLLDLAVKHDATLATQMPLAQLLNPYGVAIRYPEESATVEDARVAVDTIRKLRAVLRRKLGL